MGHLSTDTDGSGRIVAFPLSARSDLVRRTADDLADRHGSEANSYWRNTIAGLRAQMTANGISEVAIESDLRAFADSVFSRIEERCAL